MQCRSLQILIHVILASYVAAGEVAVRRAARRPAQVRKSAEHAPQIDGGPDLTVPSVVGISNYGSENGISAFSVGNEACNVGNEPLVWVSDTNQHPVVAQDMFRLENDRIEQIGMSWVRHHFYALQQDACQLGCQPWADGTHLGAGCSDVSSAGMYGSQPLLGPRWQVNGFTGYFEYPPGNPPYSGTIARRLQIHNADLDPTLHPDAVYFAQTQYVTPDDAAAGNGHNNASHREVEIVPEDGVVCRNLPGDADAYCGHATGSTQTGQPAIRAWKQHDPSVMETDVLVPGEGLFILAAKASDLGDGFWRYEYALYNMNSDRSGRAFSVRLPSGAIVENTGFHDVDYHSGEPFDLTDWPAVVSDDAITWATTPYDVNPDANALRWGTLYNFRFDANMEPGRAAITLQLFKPGQPEDVTVFTTGPSLPR